MYMHQVRRSLNIEYTTIMKKTHLVSIEWFSKRTGTSFQNGKARDYYEEKQVVLKSRSTKRNDSDTNHKS